ncbi:MAG: 50S ribosomal protein L21 [Chlamydiia bacterium]
MYAIIETGGKQYRVEQGDVLDVELLDVPESGLVEFSKVLLIQGAEGSCRVGAPFVAGAMVRGQLQRSVRGPKVIAYKYKKRKNQRRKVGHRQDYLRVQITEIAGI